MTITSSTSWAFNFVFYYSYMMGTDPDLGFSHLIPNKHVYKEEVT